MKIKRFALLACLAAALLLAAPCAWAQGENLLQNGDFSENSGALPDGWTTSAWVMDELYSSFSLADDEEQGQVAVIESAVANDARFEQTIAVEPETVYEISGLIRAENVSGEIGANLSVADTFVYTDMISDSGGAWIPVSLYVRTGEGQSSITLYARLGGYGGTATGRAEFARLSVRQAEPEAGVLVEDLTPAESGQDETETMELSRAMPLLCLVMAGAALLWYLSRRYWRLQPAVDTGVQPWRAAVASLFLAALVARLVMAVSVYGYPNDIACWKGWSQTVYETGFAGFYESGQFADYPPVYIGVLYGIGIIRNLFQLGNDSTFFLLLVKLPSILADMAAGWLIYRLACRRFSWQSALGFASFFLLNPAVLINASAWGQVDALLSLFMVGCLAMLYKNRWVEATVIMVAGILFKPQMLFIAPLFLPCLVSYVRAHSVKRSLITAGKCLGAAVLTALVIILPFSGGRGLSWIVQLYTSTLGSYPYASVNAANVAALFGGLWVENTQRVLGLSYAVWGSLGIMAAVVVALVACFKDRDRSNLLFYGALLLTGIFTLAHGMHERYMFPALFMLAFSYARTGKRMHLWCFTAFSVTQFLNMAVVLVNSHLPLNSALVFWLSLAQAVLYGLMVWAALAQAWGKPVEQCRIFHLKLPDQGKTHTLETQHARGWLGEPAPTPAKRGWDRWAVWVLTAVYAVVALVYLGDLKVPQSMWTITGEKQSFVVDLGEDAPSVKQLWQYRTLSAAGASIVVEESDDRTNWTPVTEIVLDDTAANDVFKWFTDPMVTFKRYLRFSFPTPLLRELEFALIDAQGQPVAVQAILDVQCDDPNGPALLFDEQQLIPQNPSQLNSTYFDEIYHARTAWEHKNGMSPYEVTHPPLGKIIIMLGISLFGMTPFGWRVAGAVFGILMVPMVYYLARQLLRSGKFAFVAAFMMCWDFMHFAQTRIATIDVFAVFFILCMYYFMARYLRLSHPEADRRKRALMLALCGISFGLGAATKWTCIYAGAGLAVLFFIDMGIGLRQFALARREAAPPAWTKGYWKALWIRLAWCVVFFILVPAGIYVASYAPYMLDGRFDLNVVLENQRYMLSYHTQLVDDHFFKSPWYEWPLIIKPIWFYMNNYLPEGQMGSIASFGNPAVWWVGLVAILALAVRVVRRRAGCWQDWFIVIGFLAQFLPWVLVPRSTFIYHYFASVPFIILASARLMEDIVERWPRLNRALPAYLAVVLALFILFYPVLSGLPISSAYGALLKWMPTWYFTY